MRNVALKITGLFITVFAVSQFGLADKASATAPEVNSQTKTQETTSHGCGCCCSSCGESS